MSSFTHALILEDTDDGRLWRVHTSFAYRVGDEDSRTTVPVAAGFLSDLTSIPRVFLSVVPKLSKGNAASVLHDRLYGHPYLYVDGLQDRRITKRRCDEIFYEALRVQGVDPLRSWVLYRAVRWFGRYAWTEHRRVEHEQQANTLRSVPRDPSR